jgi:hypothetical protein
MRSMFIDKYTQVRFDFLTANVFVVSDPEVEPSYPAWDKTVQKTRQTHVVRMFIDKHYRRCVVASSVSFVWATMLSRKGFVLCQVPQQQDRVQASVVLQRCDYGSAGMSMKTVSAFSAS